MGKVKVYVLKENGVVDSNILREYVKNEKWKVEVRAK